jgi:hypothetical protein
VCWVASLWVTLAALTAFPETLCTTWAFITVATGFQWLAMGRHFALPVCAALSLKFWVAVVWIGCTWSPPIPVLLGIVAFATQQSWLLFPGTLASPNCGPFVYVIFVPLTSHSPAQYSR